MTNDVARSKLRTVFGDITDRDVERGIRRIAELKKNLGYESIVQYPERYDYLLCAAGLMGIEVNIEFHYRLGLTRQGHQFYSEFIQGNRK